MTLFTLHRYVSPFDFYDCLSSFTAFSSFTDIQLRAIITQLVEGAFDTQWRIGRHNFLLFAQRFGPIDASADFSRRVLCMFTGDECVPVPYFHGVLPRDFDAQEAYLNDFLRTRGHFMLVYSRLALDSAEAGVELKRARFSFIFRDVAGDVQRAVIQLAPSGKYVVRPPQDESLLQAVAAQELAEIFSRDFDTVIDAADALRVRYDLNEFTPFPDSVRLQAASRPLDKRRLAEIRNALARDGEPDDWETLADFHGGLIVHDMITQALVTDSGASRDRWLDALSAIFSHPDAPPDVLTAPDPRVYNLTPLHRMLFWLLNEPAPDASADKRRALFHLLLQGTEQMRVLRSLLVEVITASHPSLELFADIISKVKGVLCDAAARDAYEPSAPLLTFVVDQLMFDNLSFKRTIMHLLIELQCGFLCGELQRRRSTPDAPPKKQQPKRRRKRKGRGKPKKSRSADLDQLLDDDDDDEAKEDEADSDAENTTQSTFNHVPVQHSVFHAMITQLVDAVNAAVSHFHSHLVVDSPHEDKFNLSRNHTQADRFRSMRRKQRAGSASPHGGVQVEHDFEQRDSATKRLQHQFLRRYVEARDEVGRTLVLLAASAANHSLILYLCRALRASVSVTDIQGRSLFWYASVHLHHTAGASAARWLALLRHLTRPSLQEDQGESFDPRQLHDVLAPSARGDRHRKLSERSARAMVYAQIAPPSNEPYLMITSEEVMNSTASLPRVHARAVEHSLAQSSTPSSDSLEGSPLDNLLGLFVHLTATGDIVTQDGSEDLEIALGRLLVLFMQQHARLSRRFQHFFAEHLVTQLYSADPINRWLIPVYSVINRDHVLLSVLLHHTDLPYFFDPFLSNLSPPSLLHLAVLCPDQHPNIISLLLNYDPSSLSVARTADQLFAITSFQTRRTATFKQQGPKRQSSLLSQTQTSSQLLMSQLSAASIEHCLIPDVATCDMRGRTALHLLAMRSSTDVLMHEERARRITELLVERLDVMKRDFRGMTPVHYAAKNGRAEIVQVLVSSHADVSAPTALFFDDADLLHLFKVLAGHANAQFEFLQTHPSQEQLRQLMLQRGGAVMQPEDVAFFTSFKPERVVAQETPLHLAAAAGEWKTCGELLRASATVDPLDRDGQTPLLLAARRMRVLQEWSASLGGSEEGENVLSSRSLSVRRASDAARRGSHLDQPREDDASEYVPQENLGRMYTRTQLESIKAESDVSERPDHRSIAKLLAPSAHVRDVDVVDIAAIADFCARNQVTRREVRVLERNLHNTVSTLLSNGASMEDALTASDSKIEDVLDVDDEWSRMHNRIWRLARAMHFDSAGRPVDSEQMSKRQRRMVLQLKRREEGIFNNRMNQLIIKHKYDTEVRFTRVVQLCLFVVIVAAVSTLAIFEGGRNDRGVHFLRQSVLQTLVFDEIPHDISKLPRNFEGIDSTEEFWMWAKGPFLDSLFPNSSFYWDGDVARHREPGYLVDGQTRVIGVPRFRQVRSTLEECSVPHDFPIFDDSPCMNTLDGDEPYGPGKQYTYASADELDELDQFGLATWYPGGGYEVIFPGWRDTTLAQRRADALALIESLEANQWIDLRTRAVFIEFLAVNPNNHAFLTTTLGVEFPQVGGVVSNYDVDILRMRLVMYEGDYGLLWMEGALFVFYCFFFNMIVRFVAARFNSFDDCIRCRRSHSVLVKQSLAVPAAAPVDEAVHDHDAGSTIGGRRTFDDVDVEAGGGLEEHSGKRLLRRKNGPNGIPVSASAVQMAPIKEHEEDNEDGTRQHTGVSRSKTSSVEEGEESLLNNIMSTVRLGTKRVSRRMWNKVTSFWWVADVSNLVMLIGLVGLRIYAWVLEQDIDWTMNEQFPRYTVLAQVVSLEASVVAIIVLIMYARLVSYMTVLDMFRELIVIVEMMFKQFASFTMLLALVLLAFVVAEYAAYGYKEAGAYVIGYSIVTNIGYVFNGREAPNAESYLNRPLLGIILPVLFLILVGLLLVNLLIAILTSAYEGARNRAPSFWARWQYELVLDHIRQKSMPVCSFGASAYIVGDDDFYLSYMRPSDSAKLNVSRTFNASRQGPTFTRTETAQDYAD